MPLQNRVDPFGAIQAVPSRGLFTGNRGIIHDPESRTLLRRRWTTKAWIICACEWKGRRRIPMGRNGRSGGAGWTELFFLDEVTALAAGHRPCFTCRRESAEAYRRCFAAGNVIQGQTSAPTMDTVLHGQRLATGASPTVLDDTQVRALPDGAMIAFGERAFAMRDGVLLPWSFAGYGSAARSCRSLPAGATLLTPAATVAALRAGYPAIWHPSAGRT